MLEKRKAATLCPRLEIDQGPGVEPPCASRMCGGSQCRLPWPNLFWFHRRATMAAMITNPSVRNENAERNFLTFSATHSIHFSLQCFEGFGHVVVSNAASEPFNSLSPLYTVAQSLVLSSPVRQRQATTELANSLFCLFRKDCSRSRLVEP